MSVLASNPSSPKSNGALLFPLPNLTQSAAQWIMLTTASIPQLVPKLTVPMTHQIT